MNFLIVNDDGIHAPGLRALSRAAAERGHRVTVCAPSSQQSATSHRITITGPLFVNREDWEEADAYAVDGTPADCARVSMSLMKEKADFCLSGINNGWNAGVAVYYSGTVAAAREAAMLYIPAMAVSIDVGADEEMLKNLAREAVRLAEEIVSKGGMPRMCLCNLNAPALAPDQLKGIRAAEVDGGFFLDGYEHRLSPRGRDYYWLEPGEECEPPTRGSDLDVMRQGYIACSFIGGFALLNGEMKDILHGFA